jgi:hypothetical protein
MLATDEHPGVRWFEQHRQYGSSRSFLVDMQGIDSFLYGRAKLFRDETARQAVIALGLTEPALRYLRVGASGAPRTTEHPGGEVLECSLLDGDRLGGHSTSASGFLPPGAQHSVATRLTIPPGSYLLDGRSIYSHTAFLAAHRPGDGSGTVALAIRASSDRTDVLDAVARFASVNRIAAYAVRLLVRPHPGCADPPQLVGRVLRRLPRGQLKNLGAAAAIASEQRFELRPGQQLHCFGTHHRRSEPDWERFRGGKPYEARGHLHMAVTGDPAGADQHELSHLRELSVAVGADCFVLITPVTRTVRIDPVVRRGSRLLSRSSGRVLMEVPDGVG